MDNQYPKHSQQCWLSTSVDLTYQCELIELEQRLVDQYVQSWQAELKDSTGKLRSHKLINEGFIKRDYLTLPPS